MTIMATSSSSSPLAGVARSIAKRSHATLATVVENCSGPVVSG